MQSVLVSSAKTKTGYSRLKLIKPLKNNLEVVVGLKNMDSMTSAVFNQFSSTSLVSCDVDWLLLIARGLKMNIYVSLFK